MGQMAFILAYPKKDGTRQRVRKGILRAVLKEESVTQVQVLVCKSLAIPVRYNPSQWSWSTLPLLPRWQHGEIGVNHSSTRWWVNPALFRQAVCCCAGLCGGRKDCPAMQAAGSGDAGFPLPIGDATLASLVSEAFVWFFVEIVGHYSLHMNVTEKGERVFQREPFRKSHTSRNVRHFLDLFMETQMFAGFIQDRELRKSGVKGKARLFAGAGATCTKDGSNVCIRGLGKDC